MPTTQPKPLVEIVHGGKVRLNFHRGQTRAWKSVARFVTILAGTRGGKTSFGPWWLRREIASKGPGDYLIAAPTYPLLDKGAVPEIERVFCRLLGLGRITKSPTWQFQLSSTGEAKLGFGAGVERTRLIFGHADNPDSLEAFTGKAAWLDEAGQKQFKAGSWESIQRRLSIDQGRALLTSTPYLHNWLKFEIFDRWKRRGTPSELAGDCDHEVVNFESRMNPLFPAEEWERSKATLPEWKFNMFFRGLFEKPAGMIYNCFDAETHRKPNFDIDPTWRRFVGVDFGGVNTAAVFVAEDPKSQKWFVYNEYHAGSRTSKEHADEFKIIGNGIPVNCVGGSKSEGQWRREFSQAGFPINEPDQPDVEVGIDRVYSAIKTDRLFILEKCSGLLDEIGRYSRPVDEAGNPKEGIEDKEKYHRLDALRYIIGWLNRKPLKGWKLETFN